MNVVVCGKVIPASTVTIEIDPNTKRMTVYDPCCGSAGLLIKCQLVLEEKMNLRSRKTYAPLQLYGQEYTPETWAMANMNMIIHDMQGQIEIGDSFKSKIPQRQPAADLSTA